MIIASTMTAMPQRLTWRGVNFSGFGSAVNQLLIVYCGKNWSKRTGAYQFEYWTNNIWKAFHHVELIGFVADQQNIELDYIFDLADMFSNHLEEEPVTTHV